jgi:hypothetical protein
MNVYPNSREVKAHGNVRIKLPLQDTAAPQ